MPKRSIPEATLNQAIGLLKAGKSMGEAAAQLEISKSCVKRAKDRHEETGSISHRPGTGRKRKTDEKTDRVIKRIAVLNRRKSIRALHSEVRRSNIDISLGTLCNRLNEMKFESTPTIKRQLLTRKHKQKRVEFCRKYRDWTLEDWSRVIFSDESNFRPFQRKNKQTVWYRKGVDREEDLLELKVQGGGGGIGIWGCISFFGVGCCKIYNGTIDTERYIDVIDNENLASLDTVDKFKQNLGSFF
jgi:transposase